MIARYNKCNYLYMSNRRKKEIITTKEQKTDSSFTKEGNLYFKNILEEELSDIYDVEIWVSYNANIPNTPEQWKLGSDKYVISENGILLVFAEGILPGWNVIEKNVCSQRINLSEISSARVVFVYKKKDGKMLENHLVEEISIATSELNEYFERYSKFGL
ncbi:hypothetical protein HMPREF9630_00832 [Peptoanaerobacter stomatis]|uniref:Uncharacterized protein n=1 Tax=Peptoanaerobacter stomatis TaxID=796937 RepID=V9HU77_9FIRM|nr:hypothetical protein [Peptoanaerobacter stomatis]EHL14789.1 hypothetical protein HMPREF9630_00832 [Peptoanaerobacter stomatis]